jgi:hypothetical protein
VAVPTINSVMGGSFGTASEVRSSIRLGNVVMVRPVKSNRCVAHEQACMLYTFKNAQAAAAYDAFRARAASAADSSENNRANYVDEKIPCLLHPVKANRGYGSVTPRLSSGIVAATPTAA